MKARKPAAKKAVKKASRKPPTSPPRSATKAAPRLPQRGAGRPRKPTAPRTDRQALLKDALERAEDECDAASEAYEGDKTVAAELRMMRAEMNMIARWAAYLRAQGIHTHALKYSEQVPKLAGRIVALRERISDDKLEELLKRAHHEDALGGRR